MQILLRSFWTFFIIEVSFVSYTFWDLIISPNKYLLGNSGDGMKNYYHFVNYIHSNNPSFTLNTKTNYPYGESIFYLDNVPLLSFVSKLISTYLFSVENHIIAIHNWFFIGNILGCFVLGWMLFRKLSINPYLAGIAAIILSLTNPLLYRINNHFALSFSSSIIGFYYILLCFQTALDESDFRKTWFYGFILVGWIYFASMIHMYFLALLVFPFGIYLVLALRSRLTNFPYLSLFVLPILSVVLTLKTVEFADPYFHLRPKVGAGYDWQYHNFRLDALYSAKGTPIMTIPFFVNSGYQPHYESLGYLGGFVLYSAILLFLFYVFRLSKFSIKNKFLIHVLIMGVASLFISLGNRLELFGHGGLSTDNWPSLFFWLSKFSDSVTHFRVLARFAWIFYFSAFILVLYLLDQIKTKIQIKSTIIVILCIMGMVDVCDWIIHIKKSSVNENPMRMSQFCISQLSKIDYTKYQAVYFFPYFQVGTNNLDNTLDDYEPVSRFAYGHTILSGLPMINHKASRTPDSFAAEQIHRLKNALIRNVPNGQKVLTFVYKDSVERINDFAADAYFHNRWREIVSKSKPKYLVSTEKFDVYEITI